MPASKPRVPNPLLSPAAALAVPMSLGEASGPRIVLPPTPGSDKPDTELQYMMAARSRASRIVALKGNNRRSFVGAFVAWIDGRWQTLVFESRHELKTAYVLMTTPGIEGLWDQPPHVDYIGADGLPHRHTFDYLVIINGRRYAVACKMKSSVQRLHFRSQLGLIKAQWQDFADEVLLVTEDDISTGRALAAELFHFISREQDKEADLAVLAVTERMTGYASIENVVAATGLQARAWRAIVRLVGYRKLSLLGDARIDNYSAMITRIAA